MTDDRPWEAEIEVMRECWDRLSQLDSHARARALLWLLRKQQNSGYAVDVRALEREAVQPEDV